MTNAKTIVYSETNKIVSNKTELVAITPENMNISATECIRVKGDKSSDKSCDKSNDCYVKSNIKANLPKRLENYSLIFYYDDSQNSEAVRLYVQNYKNTYWLKRGNELELESQLNLTSVTPPYLICINNEKTLNGTGVTGRDLRLFLSVC